MQRSVIALGNFDGVHLGHQRILKDAASFAGRKKLRSLAITFNPHPQQFIAPERGLKLLTTLAERKELMLGLGIQAIKVIRFDRRLRGLGYQEFIQKYISHKLRAAYVFVGYDFNFGRERAGGVSHLRRLGRKYGFVVKVIRPVKEKQHLVKSSTIRKLIAQGDFDHAITLLGHPYRLTGKVVHGSHRGRDLGIPTANLRLDEHKLVPSTGSISGKPEKGSAWSISGRGRPLGWTGWRWKCISSIFPAGYTAKRCWWTFFAGSGMRSNSRTWSS